MRSRRVLALMCAAPLVFTWMGCSNRFLGISRVSPPTGAEVSSYTARMMQLAERYEQQGNREGALRLYRQIAESEPGNSPAQDRIAAITRQVSQPAQPQPQIAIATAVPENTTPVVEAPALATPELALADRLPVQSAPMPQPGVSAPREMPVVVQSTVRQLPPADNAALPTWAGDAHVATPASESVPAHHRISEAATSWSGEDASRLADSATGASDATEVAVVEAVSTTAAWTRTSLLRLCPDANEDLLAIVARLNADDDAARKDALMAVSDLGRIGIPALPAVEVLLHDPNDSIRAHAAWAIWSIGDRGDRSVMALASLTQSESDEVVQVAAFFLGSIGADARNAVVALRGARNKASGATQLHLAEALIRIDPQDLGALNDLTRALQDQDPELRWLAAVALAGASPEQASWVVPALTARLGDSDPSVCSAAALTLGSLGPAAKSAVTSLEQQATTHQAPDVRMAAEAALACIQR